MSNKTLQLAFDEVRNSQFNFKKDSRDHDILEIRDAFIFWPNFEGRLNKFGSGVRSFNVAISEEAASILERMGFRIRSQVIQESDNPEDNLVTYFINVKVNMESPYPPAIKLFTEFNSKRNARVLDINTIGELDKTALKSCDVEINIYPSKSFPGKVTGYLNKLYAIGEDNVVFGGKYDDWLEDDTTNQNPLDGNN